MEHMIWQLKSLRKCLSANMPKWLRLKNVSFFGSEELSVDAIEDMHWRMLCKTEKIYAMNNAISLFGDSVNIWNLDKFTNMESNIHYAETHHGLNVRILIHLNFVKLFAKNIRYSVTYSHLHILLFYE